MLDTNKPSILIVDDETDMCWALQTIVARENHPSALAKSGQEALRLLDQDSFALAFVDVKLPDMDGLDLVARMRARRPGLVCFLVSGYYFDYDVPVQKSLNAGLIGGFIGKPFQLSQVREAIQKHVPELGKEIHTKENFPRK